MSAGTIPDGKAIETLREFVAFRRSGPFAGGRETSAGTSSRPVDRPGELRDPGLKPPGGRGGGSGHAERVDCADRPIRVVPVDARKIDVSFRVFPLNG
ncbi:MULTISPECIES: hypothetical protein [Saccharothrix]|uniref:hypothetical protein n=1 Tax=Saccharothrix TaxID=2071 RepID=UPI001161459E|nr:hypothetical protein [Saccharothrix sp. CB00851]